VDITELLRDKSVPINLTNKQGNTLLHVAIRKQRIFCRKGTVLNDTDVDGKYSLMMVANNDNLDVVRYLKNSY